MVTFEKKLAMNICSKYNIIKIMVEAVVNRPLQFPNKLCCDLSRQII